jgi:hypothetical protein
MDFSVEVDSVNFMVDADSEEEALEMVDEMLSNIATDWAQPYVY